MNTAFKYSLLLVLAVLGLASCTKDYDYEAATVAGQQVFFSKDLKSQVSLSESSNTFDIKINRYVTTEAATINLNVSDPSGLFKIPTSVAFAAGEDSKNITVGYNPTDFTYDDFKTVTISIGDESYTTPYGLSTYTFQAGVPSPLKFLGEGQLQDFYYFGLATTVEIYQNTNTPNVFRIMRPYDGISNETKGEDYAGSEFIDITILKPGDQLGGQTITEENTVSFSDTNTGYHNTNYDADVMLYHPSTGFKSTPTPDTWTKSRVVAYQENGLPGEIHLAPFYYMDGIGGWNATAEDAAIVILFPGYEPKDYSIEFTYDGRFTSTEDVDFAEGTITLGDDVASARWYITNSADSIESVYKGIQDGTIEGNVIRGTSTIRQQLTDAGKYYLIVVAYDADDNEVASTYFMFKFQPSSQTEETWSPVYVGDYVYGAKSYAQDGSIFFDQTTTAEGLTLYQSDQDENHYRIAPWCESETGLIFTMSDDGTVVVEDVETGFVDEEWGMIYVTDIKTYGVADMPSYYEKGVFYFNLTYHDYDGAWAFEQDTFTLTGEAAAKLMAKASAKSKFTPKNGNAKKAAARRTFIMTGSNERVK